MRVVWTLLFVLTLIGLSAASAEAGLSVSPAVIEKVLPPGSMAQGTYEVRNTGDSAIRVRVQAEDWMAVLFGKPVDIPVEAWLRIEPTEFDLAPREAKQVRFRVLTPLELKGEKVAQVYFSYEVAKGLRSKLGVILFLTAQGTEKLGFEIESGNFSVTTEKGQGRSLTVDLSLQNQSNVHVRPQGAFVILEGKKKVDEILIREIPGIYPGQSQRFSRDYPLRGIARGDYGIRLRLDYGHTYNRIDMFVQRDFPLSWKEADVRGEKA